MINSSLPFLSFLFYFLLFTYFDSSHSSLFMFCFTFFYPSSCLFSSSSSFSSILCPLLFSLLFILFPPSFLFFFILFLLIAFSSSSFFLPHICSFTSLSCSHFCSLLLFSPLLCQLFISLPSLFVYFFSYLIFILLLHLIFPHCLLFSLFSPSSTFFFPISVFHFSSIHLFSPLSVSFLSSALLLHLFLIFCLLLTSLAFLLTYFYSLFFPHFHSSPSSYFLSVPSLLPHLSFFTSLAVFHFSSLRLPFLILHLSCTFSIFPITNMPFLFFLSFFLLSCPLLSCPFSSIRFLSFHLSHSICSLCLHFHLRIPIISLRPSLELRSPVSLFLFFTPSTIFPF